FPPTANLAVEGITNRPNRESQTARKPACTPGFLAKSITCSGQIIAIDQSLPNSSRTTPSSYRTRADYSLPVSRRTATDSAHYHLAFFAEIARECAESRARERRLATCRPAVAAICAWPNA